MAEFVTTTAQDDVSVLAVSGELDIAGVEEFIARAAALLEDGRDVDLDLSGVTFIDSSGLGALVRVQKAAGSAGRRLRLSDVPRSVARILELTGLSDLFDERPER
jgi:anti-anti-sigma factor